MNTIRIATSSLLLTALCAGAHAQTFVTREQVRAEWAEAVRAGDTTPAGEGMTLRDLYPGRYGRAPATSTKTRAEVKAELAEAVRTGDIVARGEIGLKLNELHPEAYPATAIAGVGKTREQVRLELAEAIRTGDVVEGETGMKLNELYPKRYAGARAASTLAKSGEAASGIAAR